MFSDLLLSKNEKDLGQPAVLLENYTFTYADIIHLIRTAAVYIGSKENLTGKRIILCMPNGPEYIIAFFAITALGGIVVPIEPRTGQQRIRIIIEQTKPIFILCTDSLKFSSDIPVIKFVIDYSLKKIRNHDGSTNIQSENLPGLETPALILFSSGSTGSPKGAILTHRQLLKIANTLSEIIGMDCFHREYLIAPLTHSGGLQRVTSTLLRGGWLVFPSSLISIPTLINDIEKFSINGFFSSPPMIKMLLKTPPDRIKNKALNLKSIEIASAPLTSSEISKLLEIFTKANEFFQYGLTECSRALILDSRKHPDKLHTVGKPTDGVQVKIADATGNRMPIGDQGEIQLKAEQLTGGFWNNSDEYRSKIKHGWFSTGDIGTEDDEGFISYCGRVDDLINCGGNSYFPAEVEIEVKDLPGIKDYMVAGVPDPQDILTQIPWIFIVPTNPDTWDMLSFRSHLHKSLPSHMMPRKIVIVPKIPLTDSGKPSRKMAIKLYGPKTSEQHGTN